MESIIFALVSASVALAVRHKSRRYETNWAGNIVFNARTILRPKKAQEVCEIVRDGACQKVKALGTRHCFNDIADTNGVMISTENLKSISQKEAGFVELGAGVTYTELIDFLMGINRAIINVPSLPHITVVGSILTGTHGTGFDTQILASMVVGIDLVTANGEMRKISAANSPRDLNAMLVSFGTFGVITAIRIKTCPAFDIGKQMYLKLDWQVLFDHYEEVWKSAEYVSMFCTWQKRYMDSVWVGTVVKDKSSPETTSDAFFGALPIESNNIHPIPSKDPVNCVTKGRGSWGRKLYHFVPTGTPSSGALAELQSEYFFNYKDGPLALDSLFELLNPRYCDMVLVTEVRLVRGDDILMSPTYGEGEIFLAIHFTWKFDIERVLEVLPLIEKLLKRFKAKPHVGKLFTYSSQDLQDLYGDNLTQFQELRAKYDPKGKFLNSFARRNFCL